MLEPAPDPNWPLAPKNAPPNPLLFTGEGSPAGVHAFNRAIPGVLVLVAVNGEPWFVHLVKC